MSDNRRRRHTPMRSLAHTPLEQFAANWWGRVDDASRKAFFVAIGISVLAFGFEMTNLTLNHDDVWHFFIQDTILNYYMGRFGFGWLYVYTQNHYIMPFLQMAEGIVLMSVYGVLVARFWGLQKTVDIAVVAAIMCVFPYMAQTYSYNTSMALYPLAHLLAALAVIVSARATVRGVALGALLYVAAFSIYQSVAANAATIFVIWVLCRVMFGGPDGTLSMRAAGRVTTAVSLAAVAGGLLYLAAVSMMNIEFDSTQGTDEAFRLGGAARLSLAVTEIWRGTQSFFVWPERYFPDYLKGLQLAFLVAAGAACLWVPRSFRAKIAAVTLLLLACFTPRLLQLMHPVARYHSLTLTAYAVLVAGAVTIPLKAGRTFGRNMSIIVALILVGGYVLQCNWISTVNYLNTLAHFQTVTQMLARVRAVPDASWDGKKIAVVGRYDMPSDYPFRPHDGAASKFIDARHMTNLARLVRDEATFVDADHTMPKILEFARARSPWPHPGSVGVVDGMGVLVLSHPGAPSRR